MFLTVKWEGRKGAEWKCVFMNENLARVAVWSTRCTMHTMWLTSGVRPRRFRPPSSDLCRVCPRKGPEKERRGSSSHIWRREYWKRWENKVKQCRESEALRGWWEERRQHSWKDWIFLCFWFHLSFALAERRRKVNIENEIWSSHLHKWLSNLCKRPLQQEKQPGSSAKGQSAGQFCWWDP